jgi:uncharacterized membrane protein required for colicin V production
MQWSFFCMLVSSIVIEIKILLIDQILGQFVGHPVVAAVNAQPDSGL